MNLRAASIVAARELGAFFLSPVGAVVGGAFLLVQGISFWGLVRVLADPSQPAPYGAVLSTYFGGTALYWAIVFALTGALTMRLIAEERRSGTWELLCTAGISDAAIVVGKTAAAYAIYLLLWMPTLAFVGIVEVFAPPSAGLELGPVLASYLGVACVGAALIAVGVLASSLTDKQIVAALISFAAATTALLVGEISGVGLSARADMHELASGRVRLSVLAPYLAIAVCASALSSAALAARRRTFTEVMRRIALAVALAALCGALVVLSARVPAADLTGKKIHTLEDETTAVLSRLSHPIEALLVEPTIPGFAEVFAAARNVLDRMSDYQPLLRVESIDPARSDSDVGQLAASFGISADQLGQGGAVVIQSGSRRRLLDVTAVAEFERDPLGAGAMASFWAESAFAQAVAEVADERLSVVCLASGLGGLPIAQEGDGGLDWALVAEAVRRDGIHLRTVSLVNDADVGASCDAVAIVGPELTASAELAVALAAYLDEGGSLLFAARSELANGSPTAGLELVLQSHGIEVSSGVVVDPEAEVGVANVWSTSDGYAEHPITAPFLRRELATTWPAPRAVSVTGGEALVKSGPRSWTESDVAAVFAGEAITADDAERLGSSPVAAATVRDSSRIVVFGSAEFAASQFVSRGLGAGHILAARALRWLVGRDVDIPINEKSPEHLRLVMSGRARAAVFVVTVVVVPLAWLALCALLWLKRSRG